MVTFFVIFKNPLFCFSEAFLKVLSTKEMSEFYFCVFCDTVPLSLDQLSDHLSQHFAEEGNEDQISLSDIERQFVDNFVKYEKELSQSMALMPKELPKDNVRTILMGCPACDALIRCYDLIPSKDNKDICNCGQPLDDKPLFKCIQCLRFRHLECIIKSGLKSIDFSIISETF